jgi:hypothetical protein
MSYTFLIGHESAPLYAAPDIALHNFDDGTLGVFANGGGATGASVAYVTEDGESALRKTFTAGSHDAFQITYDMSDRTSVWAAWRVKFETDFEFNPSLGIFKQIRFQTGEGGTLNGTLDAQWGGWTYFFDAEDNLQSPNYWGSDASRAGWMGVTAGFLPDDLRGTFQDFECFISWEAGAYRFRFFINGEEKLDTGIVAGGVGGVMSFVQWFGTFNDPANDDMMWVARLALSSERIGPLGAA